MHFQNNRNIFPMGNELIINRTSLKIIEAEWRIYALVNNAIIVSDKGMSPVRHQAII